MKLRILLSLFLCSFASTVFAQQDLTAEWRLSIQDLERRLTGISSASDSEIPQWRTDADRLRISLVSFKESHSDIEITVPGELSATPSLQDLMQQLVALESAVSNVIRALPNSPFNLGRVEVNVSETIAAPSLVTSTIDQTEVRQLNLTNAAKALDYLPGVSIQHIATNRNEAGIMVRGFSTRGQVPLYIDGVPISVPYDGYVDFNRFLTSDIAEVQVSKGYSTPLLGPNALGGTINFVTKEPTKKFDAEALMGTGSGDTMLSSLRLGTRWRKFFAQGSVDWLQSHYIPLSGDFPVNQYKAIYPLVTMTDRLNNSWSRDEKFSGRVGWTPRENDQYVFSFINLKGQKGVPLYQGPNTGAAFRNFWVWPYWNMVNYYFHSNTQIGENSSIKFRAFYNQFNNQIDMYSDATYANMNTANAAHSIYDEHNDGASAEFNNHTWKRHSIGTSFFFKDDTHRERSIYPGRSPFPLHTPDLVDRDQQITIGAQDIIEISSRLRATIGFSADHFNGMQAQAYNAASTGVVPFTCVSEPNNTSFSGCTAHAWNFNPQAALSYYIGGGNLSVTFADRGRFPMLKDIYSSGLGAGLPNPDLKTEQARSWNVGYSHLLGARTLVQLVLFRTDVRNAIESVFVTDPGINTASNAFCSNSRILGFCSVMANVGDETHKGAEVDIRSTPLKRLTLNWSYSYLDRRLDYNFASLPNVSVPNTSITILPTLPKNKFIGTANIDIYRGMKGIVNFRYEGGLRLQDTTYAVNSPQFQAYGASYAATDLGLMLPTWHGVVVHGGVKNIFDRNYYYNAGYPEAGRNWFLNLRYSF